MVVPEDVINRGIGVQLDTAHMADLLSRMQLQAEAVQGERAVRVLVPPTRSDVLHACDVMEVCLLFRTHAISSTLCPACFELCPMCCHGCSRQLILLLLQCLLDHFQFLMA